MYFEVNQSTFFVPYYSILELLKKSSVELCIPIATGTL